MKKISVSVLVCLIVLIFDAGILAQQGEPKDRFLCWENHLFGYLDQTGKVVIKPQFANADDFHDGLALVTLRHADGSQETDFINKAGEMVIKLPTNALARRFSEGLAAPYLNDKWGYMDKTGKRLIEGPYQEALDFSDGLARVKMYDKYTFIDKAGKILVDPVFDEVMDFSGGLARVRVGSRWGYINKQGNYVWRSN